MENRHNKFLTKKNIAIIILIVIILFISIISIYNGFKNSEEINGVVFELNDDGYYTITKDLSFFSIFEKVPNELVVPNTYKNKPVTQIGQFSCEHNIELVLASNNIERINQNAFCCRCLNSINHVSNIMHLKEVVFPQNGKLESIASYAFYQCLNLERVILPINFKYFGRGCFYSCDNLTEIVMYCENPPIGFDKAFCRETYDFPIPSGITIYVPKESVQIYQNHMDFKNLTIIPITDNLL